MKVTDSGKHSSLVHYGNLLRLLKLWWYWLQVSCWWSVDQEN